MKIEQLLGFDVCLADEDADAFKEKLRALIVEKNDLQTCLGIPADDIILMNNAIRQHGGMPPNNVVEAYRRGAQDAINEATTLAHRLSVDRVERFFGKDGS